MDTATKELLEETRQTLADAQVQLSHAVELVERGGDADIDALLGETLASIKILDRQIERFLDGHEG